MVAAQLAKSPCPQAPEVPLNDVEQRSLDAEHVLRMKVAACTLMLVHEKCMNYSGHVSARLPDGVTFLIQPIDVPRSGLRPDDLLVCDLDGQVLRGTPGSKAPAEISLHAEILRVRADVLGVRQHGRQGLMHPGQIGGNIFRGFYTLRICFIIHSSTGNKYAV